MEKDILRRTYLLISTHLPLPAYLLIYLSTYLPPCSEADQPPYPERYLPTYLPTYLSTVVLAFAFLDGSYAHWCSSSIAVC